MATGYEFVRWISGGMVIGESSILNLNDLDKEYTYVRAKLYGPDDTVTGTQPFGIRNANNK